MRIGARRGALESRSAAGRKIGGGGRPRHYYVERGIYRNPGAGIDAVPTEISGEHDG